MAAVMSRESRWCKSLTTICAIVIIFMIIIVTQRGHKFGYDVTNPRFIVVRSNTSYRQNRNTVLEGTARNCS